MPYLNRFHAIWLIRHEILFLDDQTWEKLTFFHFILNIEKLCLSGRLLLSRIKVSNNVKFHAHARSKVQNMTRETKNDRNSRFQVSLNVSIRFHIVCYVMTCTKSCTACFIVFSHNSWKIRKNCFNI